MGLLFKVYGSAFPRALPFSLLSALLAGLLRAYASEAVDSQLRHPYPYQAFAFIVGFMIVFRSNLGYQRYWEGRTSLTLMTSKLTDAVVQVLTFDQGTLPDAPTPDQAEAASRFRDNIVHLVSLLHAVALQTLREDYDMENLTVHDSMQAAPPVNVTDLREGEGEAGGADVGADDVDDVKLVTSANTPFEGPGAAGVAPRHASFKANANVYTLIDIFLLRTAKHQTSYLHKAMPLPVVAGLTQSEGLCLGAFASSGANGGLETLDDEAIHGCLLENGLYAPAPTERVHMVMAWIQQIIMERRKEGGIDVPAPLLTRLYHVLSDAMLGYEQCRKLVETPFPFPWAQAVMIVLVLFTLSAPFLIAAFSTSVWVACTVTFLGVHTYIMLNEVARDIEDPFHYDPNELPLPQMQYKLNERLLAVSRTTRPKAFTDFGSLQGPGHLPQVPEVPLSLEQAPELDEIKEYHSSNTLPDGIAAVVASHVNHWKKLSAGRAHRPRSQATHSEGTPAGADSMSLPSVRSPRARLSEDLEAAVPRPGARSGVAAGHEAQVGSVVPEGRTPMADSGV